MNAPVDALTHALTTTRRLIVSASSPQDRMRALYAGAKHARDFAARDVVTEQFADLARSMGLVPGFGRAADETLSHVLSWAYRDKDPFGKRAA